ncbi:MAG: hypothetical protein U0930_22855 [Pirellulales bacterium]
MSVLLITSVLTLGSAFADDRLVGVNSKSKPTTVDFRGESYQLAYVAESPNPQDGRVINEYLPNGESLDNWTRLIAVFAYPNLNDGRNLAGQMISALKASNPLARYQIHESEDGQRIMLDFITWDTEKSITEFNIFIYQKSPDGRGSIANQFALRAYGREQGLKFMEALRDTRQQSLESITDFQFPKLTRDTKLVAETH